MILFAPAVPAQSCAHSKISTCISQWLEENATERGGNTANLADSGSAVTLLPSRPNFKAYHEALILVLPEKLTKNRSAIIEAASVATRTEQVESFIQLTLYEFFSGYPERATGSLHHASALAPEDSRVIMLTHFINGAAPHLELAVRKAGFANHVCGFTERQAGQGMELLSSKPFQQLQHQIQGLPDTSLRLQSLFLLARYMEALNQCLPLAEYYDYLVFRELLDIHSPAQQQRLANATLSTYRFYRK